MLTEQERMNNAFKEILFQEELMARKYADLVSTITEPKIQQMLKEMEQDTRSHHSFLMDKMGSLGIV